MSTGTLVDVVMPQMGVSVSEGTVIAWRKQVGETVKADETIVEISTDKVDTEVPSPAAGTVREILVPEGETVEVGTKIAVIDTGGGGAAAPAAPAAPAAEAPAPAAEVAPAAEAAPPPSRAGGAADAPDVAPPASADAPHFQAMPVVGAPAASSAADEADANGESRDLRSFMSPVVARMVAEHGLDIAKIPGTGRGGRVTKKDVEQFLGGGAPAEAAPAAAPHPPRRPLRRPRCRHRPDRRRRRRARP